MFIRRYFFRSATFNGGDENGQLVPSLFLYGIKHTGDTDDPMVAGFNSYGMASINLYNKDSTLKGPEELAEDAVRELLHLLRFEHPFKKTQGPDTKLIHDGGKNYLSTSTTDTNILYNIMNYSLINIDEKNAGNTPLNLMTIDQLNML